MEKVLGFRRGGLLVQDAGRAEDSARALVERLIELNLTSCLCLGAHSKNHARARNLHDACQFNQIGQSDYVCVYVSCCVCLRVFFGDGFLKLIFADAFINARTYVVFECDGQMSDKLQKLRT